MNYPERALWHAVLGAVLALFLAACSETPDEEQIAQNIEAIETAVEAKAFAAIGDYLHPDFLANERMDAQALKQLLRAYSFRHKNISATLLGSKTSMDPTFPDRAETVLSVVVTGSPGRLPTDGSVRTIRLAWVKQSGDWLIRRAQWRDS